MEAESITVINHRLDRRLMHLGRLRRPKEKEKREKGERHDGLR